MGKILVTNPIAKQGLNLLAKNFEVVEKYHLGFVGLKKALGEVEAVITRSDTTISKELLTKVKKLKVIGRAGIGTDNIDKKAAAKLGIKVINAPTGNALAAAEHTVGLIFSLVRKIPNANFALKKGIWGKYEFIGSQLKGKTIGIIGLGRVGKQVTKICLGIGMRVIACDPFINKIGFREQR
jgi:D-3-phosphoglycerate dehydrogenase